MTRYGVFMGDERVGTYRIHDPAFWDIHLREFHKNDGTWCSDNAMDEIKWESDDAKARVEQAIGEGCACWTLRFVVDEIEDAGPLIEVGRRPGVV